MAESEADFPQAVAAPHRRGRFQLIWLVPLVAALVGGWLAIRTLLEQGPTITITFRAAEGLEPGKTKIKLKEVEIGVVKAIGLSADRSGVVVQAQLTHRAVDFLVQDTRFWVVRPRIGGSGISGLGTLVSGAYIGVDVGKSTEERREFEGLERPPVLTAGDPGREFHLRAGELSSIDYGTPVYFRRLPVGEVIAFELDKDGGGLTIRVFVRAPYDQFVTNGTRFWEASGVDIALDASGVRINTESIASLLAGGIAFGVPPDVAPGAQAPPASIFTLFRNRTEAMKRQDLRVETYRLRFRESVRGLQVGAPVDFRGIVVGEVAGIGLEFDIKARQSNVPVEIRLYPDRFSNHPPVEAAQAPVSDEQRRRELDTLVSAGFRAQLRTGNLLTGQLYVALDLFPTAAKTTINWISTPPELPTSPGGLQELQTTVTSIATKLDRIPYEEMARGLRELQTTIASIATKLDRIPYGEIAAELRAALNEANKLVKRFDTEVTPEIRTTLEEARRTFAGAERVLASDAPLQQELRGALREVSRAAQSIRTLTETLEREPEALLRGRTKEAP